MSCYANYLLVKELCNDDVYIENLVYKIDRKDVGFNQWNGFELESVFGIKFRNILDYVDDEKMLIRKMEDEYYHSSGQNNSHSALMALKECGIRVESAGVFQQESDEDSLALKIKHKIRRGVVFSSNHRISYKFKKAAFNILRNTRSYNKPEYYCQEGNIFYPLSFDVMKDIHLLSRIESKLKESLLFSPFTEDKNIELSKIIVNTQSVSIHARRTDFLQYNNDCYEYGYFKRAVSYIKKSIKDPVFFVFSEDCEWCKANKDTLGLSETDQVFFVDWNQDEKSFRDMQLMSLCKHNIITKSSFGWWAAFLNSNPDKIIVSQVSEYYSKVYL